MFPFLPVVFFKELLNGIRMISWGAPALVYVAQSLTVIPPCPVWDKTSLAAVRYFFDVKVQIYIL